MSEAGSSCMRLYKTVHRVVQRRKHRDLSKFQRLVEVIGNSCIVLFTQSIHACLENCHRNSSSNGLYAGGFPEFTCHICNGGKVFVF
ncbi:hypothetical protein GDO78_010461 [Eleutherodactylus coqui]|uniref:Uncharacterized protein n=1 Tax=Eleutherodactylus coqui TaxID=57060 RepID=A0A8J6F625_ELECQ|nr:hypothetical protein GDO78_010461 [Eleutherodactylus coqui]